MPTFVFILCPAAYVFLVDPLWQWDHPWHLKRWHRPFNERLLKTNYLASHKVYIDTEKDPENPITFTSDKFDSFKLHGLISDAQMVGKMLDKMDESGATRGYGFLKDDVHIDKDINMNNYKNYLSESGNIYYISRFYHIMRNASMKRIYEFAESMNKCINNSLSNFILTSSALFCVCKYFLY